MNYLAHLYLSGNDPGVKVGNFIGDYVKGKRHQRYAPAIQKGILLHRRIDYFTDSHPLSRKSATIFKPSYKRYSAVVMDIIYDHFLAVNWELYSNISLHQFVSNSHSLLIRNYFTLPGTVKQFLPFLMRSRRMENYQHFTGIQRTLHIMSQHSSLPDHSSWAIEQLELNYEELKVNFLVFFDEVQKMSADFLETDLNGPILQG